MWSNPRWKPPILAPLARTSNRTPLDSLDSPCSIPLGGIQHTITRRQVNEIYSGKFMPACGRQAAEEVIMTKRLLSGWSQ